VRRSPKRERGRPRSRFGLLTRPTVLALTVHYVFANHHRFIFFALPYVLHVSAFVVGLWRAARHPSALKDDFSDTDLLRHRDVTLPGVRRTPRPGPDLSDPRMGV
jgi:hypothetical protein